MAPEAIPHVPVRTAADVLGLAWPAMHRILTEEELTAAGAVVVDRVPAGPANAGFRVLEPDELVEEDERYLRVTVLGESTWVWLSAAVVEDDDELLERIVDQLQDFVAESAFGWGQQRG